VKPEPLLTDYRVCLVVPQSGLNAAQLAEVTARVKQVVSLLPEGGRVLMVVPTYDSEQPELGVQPEVRDLERLGARVVLEGYDPRRGGAAGTICHGAESRHRCDEVWCCPESTNRRARANQVYAIGRYGPHASKYKMIPPWVEPMGVAKPAAKQTKKERPW
jgi:hypothetical protein